MLSIAYQYSSDRISQGDYTTRYAVFYQLYVSRDSTSYLYADR